MSRTKTPEQYEAAYNWLSTRQVAGRLGVSREQVRLLIKGGHLGPSGVVNISRSTRVNYRISSEELGRFMRESEERYLQKLKKERHGEPQTA